MVPFKQLSRYDCFRTCLACLLEMNPLNVPDFYEEFPLEDQESVDKWYNAYQDFCATQGFKIVNLHVTTPDGVPGILEWMGNNNPDTYYILSGNTEASSTVGHSVIALGGMIAHDPYPGGLRLTGPLHHGAFEIEFLIPLKFTAKGG